MDFRLQVRPFDAAALHHMSPGLITSHLQDKLGGAVNRLHAMRTEFAATALPAAPGLRLDGRKREGQRAGNSMLLQVRNFRNRGIDGWQGAGQPLPDRPGTQQP